MRTCVQSVGPGKRAPSCPTSLWTHSLLIPRGGCTRLRTSRRGPREAVQPAAGGGARTRGHSLVGDLLEDEVVQQGELLGDLQGRVVFKGLCLDAFRLRGTSPESGPPASPLPLWCDLGLVLGGGGKGTAGACAGPCSVSQHSRRKEAALSRTGPRPQRRREDCAWPTSVGRTRAAWVWSPAVSSGSP